jgi:hypothetical protein
MADNSDPTERAATNRLQQAIQRIQKNRIQRLYPAGGAGKSDPVNLEQGRDW